MCSHKISQCKHSYYFGAKMKKRTIALLPAIFTSLSLVMLFASFSSAQLQSVTQQKLQQATDPNFDPNWAWIENKRYNLYYRGVSGIVEQPNVNLPYFSSSGPTKIFHSDIPGVRDIAPQDGWVLLFRDFGTPTRPAEPPRIILYNRYRGILRLFYYNSHFSETFTYGVVALSWQSISLSRGFAAFTFNDFLHHTLDDFDKDRTEGCISKLEPFQWSYADFSIVGYDPVLPDDAKFSFQIKGFRVGEIELSGEEKLVQVVDEANVGFSLDKAVNIAQSAYKQYKDINGVIKDLSTVVDKANKKSREEGTPLPWYIPMLASFVQNPGVTQYAPWLGAAAVVFQGIVGATNQPQPIRFEGQLSLEGQIIFRSDIISFLMGVPGAKHLGQDRENLPFYDKPLGIFNLVTRPEIVYTNARGARIVKCGNIGTDDSREYWTATYGDIEVITNPNAGSISFEAALVPFPDAPDFVVSSSANGYFPIKDYDDNLFIFEETSCEYIGRKIGQLKTANWPLWKEVNPDFRGYVPLRRNVSIRVTVTTENPQVNFVPITFIKSYIPRYIRHPRFGYDPQGRQRVTFIRGEMPSGDKRLTFTTGGVIGWDYIVRNNAELILKAQKEILFQPNFKVELGGYLKATAVKQIK